MLSDTKQRLAEMCNAVRQKNLAAYLTDSTLGELRAAMKNARRVVRTGASLERIQRAELRLARAVIAAFKSNKGIPQGAENA